MSPTGSPGKPSAGSSNSRAACPWGIAGIYRKWRHPDGREIFTFAMLTVNADGHPVMQRFHKQGEEKRMMVILDPQDYGS
jgi:putative SOS response-associated peptidase YedK